MLCYVMLPRTSIEGWHSINSTVVVQRYFSSETSVSVNKYYVLKLLLSVVVNLSPSFMAPSCLDNNVQTVQCYYRAPIEMCRLKAKFHYTDPTRTGPDTDKVRAHCRRRAKFHYTDTDTDTDPTRTKSVHVVGYELNSTTRTRPDPHGPNVRGLCPCPVRVGSVSGPCSGI